MAIQPTQPQSIGGVLDISFQLYKASIGSVWPICLLLVLASSPPSIYMAMQGGAVADANDPLAVFAIFSAPSYWLTYALTLLVSLWAMGALYLKEHAIGTGTDLATGAALQAALGRVLALFVMSILFFIALMIGLVLLLIPGLILLVSLMLAWNLAVLEGKGPLAALTESHRLVWGNWWRTATILTVGFVIAFIIYVAIGFVIAIALPLLRIGAQDAVLFQLASGVILGVIINLVVTPYYIALLTSIYWDLKLRKEGGDLAARVAALGAA